MIFGIGCDLCAIPRMEKSLTGPHGAAFGRRVFGPEERLALGLDPEDPAPLTPRRIASAAADFAAKEAFLKACGTGIGGFALCEIQVLRKESGAPYYALTGQAADWLKQNRLTAHLSLSHDGGLAQAFTILEQTGD